MDECLTARPVDQSVDVLALTGRLHAALASSTDDATVRPRLVALAKAHAAGGLASSAALVDDIRALATDVLDRSTSAEHPFALTLLAECALYDAVAGKPASSIATIVARGARSTDANARFRTHRVAFAGALAAGILDVACHHAEAGYHAARATGDLAPKFESLILVVLLLETMGLWRHARDLAHDLARCGGDGDALEPLRLANATHGLRISHRLDDLDAATLFHTRIRDAIESQRFDGLAAAVGAGAMATHQLWIGKPRSAMRAMESILAQPSVTSNPRAQALLHGIDCDVRLAIGDPDAIRRSVDAIDALLPRFATSSPVHLALLRTSIRLELASASDANPRDESVALERYRRRPEATRPVAIGVEFLWWVAAERVEAGRRASLSSWRAGEPVPDHQPSLAEIGFDVDDFIDRATHLCAAENEAARRTPHYDIAEGWAIAAEIAAGGSGRQCFKVGRVAAALAAALGFSDERCVMLDMACRLRDFGRSVVDCVAGDGGMRVPQDRVDAERARAADRMLSFSSDPVLRLARVIATHRRAWWNGSGFPAAVRAEAIPIEARICAVADTLVGMVDPLDRTRPWPIDRAVQQIGCLAGVQFDPMLVGLLAKVLRHGHPADHAADADDFARRSRPIRTEESMAKAKKHLFETLELVDESVPASN